ncbi:MAG: sulfite exporter TauE/SafE family protein, partial [Rubrivivax sp.]|nr:sulfite exporter TauE/SafE family protein [Rubrivivax sp.]
TLRGVIQNFNLVKLAVTFTSYVITGIVKPAMVPQLAVVAAVLLVPVLLGARLYAGISQEAFKRVVLTLLACTGVALLGRGLHQLL